MTDEGDPDDLRSLLAVPHVERSDPTDLADYRWLIRRLRSTQRQEEPRASHRKCANSLCPLPGGLFEPRDQESITQYEVRKYCSQACSNQGQNRISHQTAYPGAEDVVKHCLSCGTLLAKREGEEWRKYLSRKYCGRACAADAQRNADCRQSKSRQRRTSLTTRDPASLLEIN